MGLGGGGTSNTQHPTSNSQCPSVALEQLDVGSWMLVLDVSSAPQPHALLPPLCRHVRPVDFLPPHRARRRQTQRHLHPRR